MFCSVLKRLPGKRNTLLLCGMESHICVTQTALGALREGYLVHVASDAVSSRTEWNWKIGLERMRAAGAVISSTEMMIYELMRSSAAAAFRELLPHLKGEFRNPCRGFSFVPPGLVPHSAIAYPRLAPVGCILSPLCGCNM